MKGAEEDRAVTGGGEQAGNWLRGGRGIMGCVKLHLHLNTFVPCCICICQSHPGLNLTAGLRTAPQSYQLAEHSEHIPCLLPMPWSAHPDTATARSASEHPPMPFLPLLSRQRGFGVSLCCCSPADLCPGQARGPWGVMGLGPTPKG